LYYILLFHLIIAVHERPLGLAMLRSFTLKNKGWSPGFTRDFHPQLRELIASMLNYEPSDRKNTEEIKAILYKITGNDNYNTA
jgi:hypothetical protein